MLFRDLTKKELIERWTIEDLLACNNEMIHPELTKDEWGRTRPQVWRIYGKERCLKEWGDRLPTPMDIIEYKKNWVEKAWKAKQYIICKPVMGVTKITKWLRNYSINRLDYDNVYRDTIVVRDPHTFVIMKLYFSEQTG